MIKLKLEQVYEYVEQNISVFHKRRLDYIQNKVNL